MAPSSNRLSPTTRLPADPHCGYNCSKAEAMGPSGFSLDQQGSVEATGSELHISWANKWASWERSEGFDYD